jgi:hypothetical protein
MKKIAHYLFICLSMILFFSSCSSDDESIQEENLITVVKHTPGQIPGFGNTPGEITGEKFYLPAGINLKEGIRGYTEDSKYFQPDEDLISLMLSDFSKNSMINFSQKSSENNLTVQSERGSGTSVVLIVSLENTTDKSIVVEFPAGLIFESKSKQVQHGVLLKKTQVKVPAKSTYNVRMFTYCGNLGIPSPNQTQDIELLGIMTISNSSLIRELCDLLANKKINYEEFTMPEEWDIFNKQCNKLQGFIWKQTNGKGIDNKDREYINSLPKSN